MPLGLDIHPITCSLGVPTRHFDVRFLRRRARRAPSRRRRDESLDLHWFEWDALPVDISPELPRLVEAARIRLGL